MLTGRLTANAASYSDNVTRTISNTQWSSTPYALKYRVSVMGSSPYYVQPLSFTLNGDGGSYGSSALGYDVSVYDNSNSLLWTSAPNGGDGFGLNHWGDTLTPAALTPALYSDTDIAFRIEFIVYRLNTNSIYASNLGDVNVTINCTYDDMQEPETTAPPPFELPNDWVLNTTNTIADEFVPFTTVTTPISPDDVDDTIDDFKDFLEGVQDYESLATVFMGYVSELLRLKGLTPFLCFAICCITIITVFELSGGD